jgi:hypothetical protein
VLPDVHDHNGFSAKTLLDAGCGDFNWMRHVNLKLDQYIGIDVVPELICENQRQFGKCHHDISEY